MNIDTIIQDQRLFIDGKYEQIASLFCNLAGAKTSETKNRFLLSNWFEGYLYTTLLGIKVENREIRIGERLDKSPKWSKNYIDQYKYILTLLLSKPDILNEINLLNRELIKINFISIDNTMDELKKICDEYSNGGLKYLNGLYEKNGAIFNDYNSLSNIYRQASKEKIR